MTYPTDTYPTAPGFPIGHEDVPLGEDLYQVVASYISDLVTDINLLSGHDGNVELGATEGVEWDSTIHISLSGGEVKFLSIETLTDLNVTTATLDTANVTDDISILGDLIIDGDIAVTGSVTVDHVERDVQTLTQAAEPGDPPNNTAVMWVSNGTGYGDAGDLCCKITEGGGTTSFTISDYTAL